VATEERGQGHNLFQHFCYKEIGVV